MQEKILHVSETTSKELCSEIDRLIRERFAELEKKITPKKSTTYLSREDVAKLFGITVQTVHDWSKKGFLQPYKFGGSTKIFFKNSEIEALMIKQETKKKGYHG